MSYSIGLMLDEPDSEDASAFREFEALSDAMDLDAAPAPEFVALHDELTARFPCLCSLPDDEVDDSVWADGPLINNFCGRVAVIGFVYSGVEEALPFVLDSAARHHVTVFDWQTGQVHRPSRPESSTRRS